MSFQKFSGLNVKNIESWDKAAIDKHIWAVAAKNDVFWQNRYIHII